MENTAEVIVAGQKVQQLQGLLGRKKGEIRGHGKALIGGGLGTASRSGAFAGSG
jgi:hypothetical protein